jgi:hypothetical protein
MRRLVSVFLATALVALASLDACSSDNSSGSQSYGPCHGEPGACTDAESTGTVSGLDHCLCTHFCTTAADCPVPGTGTAKPICKPFGDVVANGHTASCSLPCDASHTCPDGMECYNDECWVPIGK